MRTTDPQLLPSRRRLLQIGGIGALGLGLPQLLRAGTTGNSPSRSREKSCIFIVQYGGASHIDSLDPKPDAPDDVRGPYKPIPTSVPGVRVGELLPRLAKMAGRYCLVRSMSHGNGGHDGGMHVAMTGHSALLAGAGVRGGMVHGASDKHGGYVRDNPVSPESFGATLFHALGVPPETRLGADGFTNPASAGRPVEALFG
jgi:hypothetical protein